MSTCKFYWLYTAGKLQNRKSTWFFWLNALFFHFFRRITCEKFQFANNYKKSRLFFSTSERCKWDCRKSESLYLHFFCFIRLIVMSRSAEDKIVWIFIMLYNFNWTFQNYSRPSKQYVHTWLGSIPIDSKRSSSLWYLSDVKFWILRISSIIFA